MIEMAKDQKSKSLWFNFERLSYGGESIHNVVSTILYACIHDRLANEKKLFSVSEHQQ